MFAPASSHGFLERRKKYAQRLKPGIPACILEARTCGRWRVAPHDGKPSEKSKYAGRGSQRPTTKCPRNHARWSPDGWLRTGDMGHIDEDGYLKLVDRSKDLIKSGGEWISSLDLENALMGHPCVKEAAIIGVPHPKWQERPLAVVVLNEGAKCGSRGNCANIFPQNSRSGNCPTRSYSPKKFLARR